MSVTYSEQYIMPLCHLAELRFLFTGLGPESLLSVNTIQSHFTMLSLHFSQSDLTIPHQLATLLDIHFISVQAEDGYCGLQKPPRNRIYKMLITKGFLKLTFPKVLCPKEEHLLTAKKKKQKNSLSQQNSLKSCGLVEKIIQGSGHKSTLRKISHRYLFCPSLLRLLLQS